MSEKWMYSLSKLRSVLFKAMFFSGQTGENENHIIHGELLSILSLGYLGALSTVFLLFLFSPSPINPGYRSIALAGLSAALFSSFLAFSLNRAGRTQLAAMLLAAGNMFAIFYAIFISPDEIILSKMLGNATPWIAFSILICGLSLPKRGLHYTIVVILLVCSIATIFIPITLVQDYLVDLTFLMAISMVAEVWTFLLDRKAAKEKEHQARMVNASRTSALGEMAGGIAHEINSPLATICVLSSQIQELLTDETLDLKAIQDMAQAIETTGTRISKIINGMRSFSRDESHAPFKLTTIDTVVEETLSFCRDRFRNHGITLELEPVLKNLQIECHSTQISQVILNLLNNAFDAIEHLTEKWVRISGENREHSVHVSITDSGNGIPRHIQKKLFQPFFTTKEIGKGTGLGLDISKKIIKAHGGTLSLNNECKNTQFIIYLPKKITAKLP